MSEMCEILTDTANRIFSEQVTRKLLDEAEAGVWPEALWNVLYEAGMTGLAVSEVRGGAGVDPGDQLAVIRRSAFHVAPVPLAETLIGEQMLAAAELPPIEGPLTVAPLYPNDVLTLSCKDGGWRLDGILLRVPFARHVSAVVAVADYEGQSVTVVIRPPFNLTQGNSHANEPRDTLTLNDHPVAETDVGRPGVGSSRLDVALRGALVRAVQMVGAMEHMLEATVRYALERSQFGRPIAKFQAVQHQIAMLASHTSGASAAVQGAISASQTGLALFEIAAAKARAGDAAALVIEFAHQVHGAMGFTRDHSLHFLTRRLWTWRDEFGTEAEWNTRIGHTVARLGGEELWAFLTAEHKDMESMSLEAV